MEKIRFLATIQAVLLSFVTSVPIFFYFINHKFCYMREKKFLKHMCAVAYADFCFRMRICVLYTVGATLYKEKCYIV